jgi:steroid 5-alpha reductase family enzyme
MNDLVLSLAAVVIFNIVMFFVAFRLQTDKLTDITYSLSFIFLVLFGWFRSGSTSDLTNLVTGILVLCWGIRLGAYLFHRVSVLGKDVRFDEIRINFKRFFRFFLIQGVSSWIISLPFLICFYSDSTSNTGTPVVYLGWTIAIIGLIMETVADQQKSNFKNTPGNRDQFYTGGLYRYVRYPNYLGEILFWIGIFIACVSCFKGLDWLSMISPIVIILLLTKLSGIPILEKSRLEKMGADPSYKAYIKSTPMLFPGY